MFDVADEVPEIELSVQRVEHMLVQIKRNSRNRRIAMVAPVALVAAVLATMAAAPPRYGGIALVPDAQAAHTELPRVFGSNGVWRLAEPITDAPDQDLGPAAVVETLTEPSSPSFVLSPPDQEDLSSLPASTSTPPTSTSGQYPEAPEPLTEMSEEPLNTADLDWSSFTPVIRTEPQEVATQEQAQQEDAQQEDAPVEDAPLATTEGETSSPPDPQLRAEDAAIPELSSTDEDVTVAVQPQDEPTGTEADTAIDVGEAFAATPSTPPDVSTDAETAPQSAVATITQQSVLVYSAHVSVTVKVVDDDSSVIDWCNTRVDWGDGSVTGVANVDGVATCTATCEYEAKPSTAGIDTDIEFTYEYSAVIDATPRIFVATGDGCNYTLAELQLDPFTVVPF